MYIKYNKGGFMISKFIKIGLLFISVSIICAGFSLAADQDRKRDRKKDGSCQTELTPSAAGITLAADQDRKRDRKKDGSCQTELTPSAAGIILAADQDRKRDTKKDGSCQTDAIS
jgi:hypothetical protein